MTSTHTNLTYIKALLANVIILAMLLISSSQTVLAAVPQSINYQGFLADDSGVPIDATHNITFRIYTASSGGSAVYTSSQSVAIVDGRFDTELGSSPNFPANLFDGTQLFLGLEIDSDGEMTPRQPLTSTPYAYKSEDADTVGGVDAASLDQSAHLVDTDNPHDVTAAQLGATDATTFNQHTTDFDQLEVDYTAHKNISGAHHLEYTDADAVNAMGIKSNANALNHDRFTSADALSAVLESDGDGSNLDADLLDGMQANEIIDAASLEARTPILDSDLPLTISAPGSFYFAENLIHEALSGRAINIDANHVTIDMMGFTLTGPGKTAGSFSSTGIGMTNQRNVTIKNGTVRQFGASGILESNVGGNGHRIINVRSVENGSEGISLLGYANQVIDCAASLNGVLGGTGLGGIFAGDGSLLQNNISSLNVGTYGIGGADGSTLVSNTSHANNTVSGVYGGDGAVLIKNTSSETVGENGIRGGEGSTIVNNTALSNTENGIFAGESAAIKNNSSKENGSWGIEARGANLIEGNAVSSNNQDLTDDIGGILVLNSSRVTNNVVHANPGTNIFVLGSRSVLERNHVVASNAASTQSGCGIRYTNTSTFSRDNTASSNGPFGLSAFCGVVLPSTKDINNINFN